jgi:hypothetical protein
MSAETHVAAELRNPVTTGGAGLSFSFASIALKPRIPPK